MMKRTLLCFALIATLLTTAGCLGLTDSPEDTTAKKYSINDLVVDIPHEWEVLTRQDVPSTYPESFLLGFVSPVKNERFTANGNVQKTQLSEMITSLDYGRMMLQSHKNTLTNFSEKDREEVTARIGGEDVPTLVVTFEGKQKPDTDTIRFVQTFLVKGQDAYLITGAFVPSEDTVIQEKIKAVVRSAEIK